MFVSVKISNIMYASSSLVFFYVSVSSMTRAVADCSMRVFGVGKLLYVCIFCYHFARILLHPRWLGRGMGRSWVAAWAAQ